MFPLNVGMVVVCYQATYNIILLENDRVKSYIHMVLYMSIYVVMENMDVHYLDVLLCWAGLLMERPWRSAWVRAFSGNRLR
jgi:hypothetical protein